MSDLKRAEITQSVDPSWKTPADLKITASEFAALISVRELLMKEIRHAGIKRRFQFSFTRGFYRLWRMLPDTPKGAPLFNMAFPCMVDECGTSYCVGGWVCRTINPNADRGEVRAYVEAGRSHALHYLFYPRRHEMTSITALQAAREIGNFLSTGKNDW